MTRLVSATALLAVALTAIILSANGSAQQTGERTFTLITRDSESNSGLVDTPPRSPRFREGLSAGDVFVEHRPARNRAGRRVGSLDISCTATQGGPNFTHSRYICIGTASLKRGMITVEDAFDGRERVNTIAVTGGSGVYEGATGSVTSTSYPHGDVAVVHLLG
jgi:hypothetical protein